MKCYRNLVSLTDFPFCRSIQVLTRVFN